MMMHRCVAAALRRGALVLALAAALGACSTKVTYDRPLAADLGQGIAVRDVATMAAPDVAASPAFLASLATEIRRATAERSVAAGRPLKLAATVTHVRIRGSALRLGTGVFSGANRLTVTVALRDPESGAVLGQFNVARESNPGGYGAFYDQEAATIRVVADAIADAVFAPGAR